MWTSCGPTMVYFTLSVCRPVVGAGAGAGAGAGVGVVQAPPPSPEFLEVKKNNFTQKYQNIL